SASDAEARELRHRAATIARGSLGDSQKAIELLARLFEDDPSDATAARALRELYEAEGSYDELAQLLERLVDVATSPAERGSLRMELGKLHAERFNKIDRAVDLFRDVIEEE